VLLALPWLSPTPTASPRWPRRASTPTPCAGQDDTLPAHRAHRHRKPVPALPNGNLQFSSVDEYRYHEGAGASGPSRSGRGAGACRPGRGRRPRRPRILRHPLRGGDRARGPGPRDDPARVENPMLRELNQLVAPRPRVRVVNETRSSGWGTRGSRPLRRGLVISPTRQLSRWASSTRRGSNASARARRRTEWRPSSTSPLHARPLVLVHQPDLEAAGFQSRLPRARPVVGEWASRWRRPALRVPTVPAPGLRYLDAPTSPRVVLVTTWRPSRRGESPEQTSPRAYYEAEWRRWNEISR